MENPINSQTLRQLREARGLTQEQLAARCNCAKDTVSRWERGQTSRVRSHLREPLCKALGTEWDKLTQPPEKAPATRDDLVQISARIRPETRNALQAVCERYNVDQRIVFEYAPLLFLIAAEKSLKSRREILDQIEAEIWSGYDAMYKRAPYLGSYAPNISATEAIDEEQEAIAKRNLFRNGCYVLDDDEFDPFVIFLKAQAEGLPEGAVQYIETRFAGYAEYWVATDTIDAALGLDSSTESKEDNRLHGAISSGAVELRTAISQKLKLTEAEFREWLEASLTETATDITTRMRDILDAVEFGVVEKNDVLKALKAEASEKDNEEKER